MNINKWKHSLNILISQVLGLCESNTECLRFNNDNKKLYAYGASGRANTLMEFMNVKFDVIFDDSKSKINKFTPKNHTKILDSMNIYNDSSISCIFILAWTYQHDIIKKHEKFLKEGGTFIIVLPEIKVISYNNSFIFNHI